MAETSVAITPGVGKTIDGFDAGGGMRQAVVVADAVTIGNTQAVSAAGAAKVDGSAVTQPVSMATAPTTPITAASLPLPAGAALDATLTGGTTRAKITDGTNNAAVKAASTAAVATDPALVVVISPNNVVPISLATAPTTPITAAALPLPTGAATSVKQPAIGTAGASSVDVITVQGIASGTPQPVAIGASAPLSTTLQSAAVAIGNGTAQTITGYVQTVINVTGVFVGTIVFEGSTDNGANYNIPLLAQQLGVTTTPATSTSTIGAFRISVDGLTNFRARISAWTSGSITVVSNATPLATTNQIAAVNNATKFAGEDLTNDILKTNTVFSCPIRCARSVA